MDQRPTKTTMQIELSEGVDCYINADDGVVKVQMDDGEQGVVIANIELTEEDTREVIYALRKAMYDNGWTAAKAGDEDEQPPRENIGFIRRRGKRR